MPKNLLFSFVHLHYVAGWRVQVHTSLMDGADAPRRVLNEVTVLQPRLKYTQQYSSPMQDHFYSRKYQIFSPRTEGSWTILTRHAAADTNTRAFPGGQPILQPATCSQSAFSFKVSDRFSTWPLTEWHISNPVEIAPLCIEKLLLACRFYEIIDLVCATETILTA